MSGLKAVLGAVMLLLGLHDEASAFGSDDKWTAGWGQGVAEAIVTKGPGNRMYVTCDDGAARNATKISFTLHGKSPTGRSVLLTFDNKDPQDFAIWDGEIRSDCRTCAATYDHVISLLKAHSSVHVRFENGEATRFTLKGASKTIGQCKADFYR